MMRSGAATLSAASVPSNTGIADRMHSTTPTMMPRVQVSRYAACFSFTMPDTP